MNEDIEEDGDFLVNEKDKQIMLTADGVKKVEKFFHIENLADPREPCDPAQYHLSTSCT